MANQINEQAAPLDLTDTSGKAVSLYKIKAPLTIYCFLGSALQPLPVADSKA